MLHTPLYEEHKKLNARFTEFGGWEMPVMYSSIIEEHNAVRNKAGIFDASHMGEFIVSGPKADEFLKKVTVCDVTLLKPGQAKYSLFLNDNAGIVDDLLVYRRKNDYFLVVNASNTEKDYNWLTKHLIEGVKLENLSEGLSLIALQGPDSEKIFSQFVKNDLKQIKNFEFFNAEFKDIKCDFALISRTGYTGEDGFEIFISNSAAPLMWQKLVAAGAKPCGLGCRDSLRLEACMSLHGHEINDETTPLEAGLGWTISWNNDFISKEKLVKQKETGVKRFLTAFLLDGGIARENCAIMLNLKQIGKVTSGTFSPTLKKAICMGYVDVKLEPGATVEIVVHNQPRTAKVVKKPFYKRAK